VQCFVELAAEEQADQGWAAWAWSFVPQLTSTDAELSSEFTAADGQQSARKAEQSVIDMGIYIMQASVVFKVCVCIVHLESCC